jgi:hypothetical protein
MDKGKVGWPYFGDAALGTYPPPGQYAFGKHSVNNCPVFVNLDVYTLDKEVAHELDAILALNLVLRNLAQISI